MDNNLDYWIGGTITPVNTTPTHTSPSTETRTTGHTTATAPQTGSAKTKSVNTELRPAVTQATTTTTRTPSNGDVRNTAVTDSNGILVVYQEKNLNMSMIGNGIDNSVGVIGLTASVLTFVPGVNIPFLGAVGLVASIWGVVTLEWDV